MEKGNRGLVRLQLGDAAGTPREVLLEALVDLWREVMFDEVRQQAHEFVTAFHGGFSRNPVEVVGSSRENPSQSPFRVIRGQKSYPIHIENRGFLNQSLPNWLFSRP
jgi:hypothetical protein